MSRTIRPDDSWFNVRSRFLGPSDFTLPFAARYTAWALMTFLILATLTGDYLLGLLPAHPGLTAWTLTFVILAGGLLLRFTTAEMNIRQVLALAAGERRHRGPAPIATRQQLKVRL